MNEISLQRLLVSDREKRKKWVGNIIRVYGGEALL